MIYGVKIALTMCELTIITTTGIHKLRKDFTFMLESAVSWVWAPVWGFVLPFTLLVRTLWDIILKWLLDYKYFDYLYVWKLYLFIYLFILFYLFIFFF